MSGHGKGLVDAINAFGVKGPPRKQIIINKDFFFLSAEEIHSSLCSEMKDKPERKYYMINDEDVQLVRKSRGGFPIMMSMMSL